MCIDAPMTELIELSPNGVNAAVQPAVMRRVSQGPRTLADRRPGFSELTERGRLPASIDPAEPSLSKC